MAKQNYWPDIEIPKFTGDLDGKRKNNEGYNPESNILNNPYKARLVKDNKRLRDRVTNGFFIPGPQKEIDKTNMKALRGKIKEIEKKIKITSPIDNLEQAKHKKTGWIQRSIKNLFKKNR